MMVMTKIACIILFAFSCLFPCSAASGRWRLLRSSIGVSAMHMALLPNDRVIVYDRTDAGRSNISLPSGRCGEKHDCTAHSVELDLATRAVRPLTVLTDTWCSSGALSANGTLVQSGGYNAGDRVVRFFSPCDGCDWTEDVGGLAKSRWYATNHILPDGRIIVVGGRNQFNYEFIPKASSSGYPAFELPFLSETTDGRRWENNLYPFLHLSPDGHLFVFANTKSILLDYINHRVVRAFPEIPGGIARNYPSTGSSVLLPLQLDSAAADVRAEVMVCGGTVPTANPVAMNGTFLPASNTCGRLAITDESPEWAMEEMPMGRVMGDMVLLPTADVLIINGAMKGSAGWGMAREPALYPLLYRTGITSEANRTFEVMEPAVIPRLYHSTALLIPDGRVLIGGSNPNARYEFSRVLYPTQLSVDAFYPPYLSPLLPRPSITSVEPGPEIRYGQRLSVEFLAKKRLRGQWKGVDGVHVTMLAPAFNTHSFTMNQRVLVLKVDGVRHFSGRNYAVDVLAPASPALAPPGYYLVFVVHGGIPSRGRWVRIKQ